MDCNTQGFPVHNQLLEPTQTHVHCISDAIQPFHPLSCPSPPALNLSQHQGTFKWVNSLHQVAKVLKFQLQHQFFQWIFRVDWLVWSPCCPRDSQESSPTPQFKSISSLVLSLFTIQLSHPYMTTGKAIALLYRPLLAKRCLWFLIHCLGFSKLFFQGVSVLWFHGCSYGLHLFCSQEDEIWHYFHIFPIYLPWSDRTWCHDICFLNVEF